MTEVMTEPKRYALIEHHHRGGLYGEEQWTTFSMDERHDGGFVEWGDYEARLAALEVENQRLSAELDRMVEARMVLGNDLQARCTALRG